MPLEPDRLLPVDPATRAIARSLYEEVAGLPIISPHGHVPAAMLAQNAAFPDPATLLISDDHYVIRLLHASGVPMQDLRPGSRQESRAIWRTLAEHWHEFGGTASAYWLREELAQVFGETDELSPANADEMYDRIAARLTEPSMRPRALVAQFGIEVLATTDDPLDDLASHRALAQDPGFSARVLPTFRPDGYLDPGSATFTHDAYRLLAATGQPDTFTGYLAALQQRRAFFVANGAVSVDVGVTDPFTTDLSAEQAQRFFADALAGRLSSAGVRLLRGHLLFQQARLSLDDGLVLTLHAGVHRNHSSLTFQRFGADTGHDIPVPTSFTESLHPLLEAFGLEPDFHLVVFTVDETVYSRELAPLAGFYPSVFIGAPWWFLDAPDAIARWRSLVTETAGFYRTGGFIDDTRAFLSIPARHDTARRVDAAFLARLVREGRLSAGLARRINRDLVEMVPRRAFKL